MPNRIPTLVITFPQPNALVGHAQFNVTGTVTAPGAPEPVGINSVTVQVNGQAPVRAALKHITNKQQVEVTFSAPVQIVSGDDPHTITVTVASDSGSISQHVNVIAGSTFVPTPPAIVIDVAPLITPDFSLQDIADTLQPSLSSMASQLSKTPIIGKLAALNKILVGPSLLQVTSPRPMIRIGLWILDSSFPTQDLIPKTKDFPLAQLMQGPAVTCFKLAPLLNPPDPASESAVPPALLTISSFALSVPTTTLQTILDAYRPDLVAQAAQNHFTVTTSFIKTSAPATVTTTLSGSLPLGVPMTATIAETVGIAQRSGTVLSKMPTVLHSDPHTSVGDDLDWFIGSLVPAIGLGILGMFVLADIGVGEAAGQAAGLLTDYLASVPPWFPFRNSALPPSTQAIFPFPMAVLNFDSFGCTANALVGTGSVGLLNRVQSMVALTLAGASSFPNYSFGIESLYTVGLTAFEPDDDEMTWQVTGSPKKRSFSTDPVFQVGSFLGEFPVTLKTAPGKYPFTLSATATETCATDSSQTLTGSVSKKVSVTVVKGPPAEPAPKAEPALAASQNE
jgi:hypothetical protein